MTGPDVPAETRPAEPAWARLLAERRISLLSGSGSLRASEASPGRLREEIAQHAEVARLPGLPDELNPVLLDPRKVIAFVEGLPRHRDDVLRRLEGKFLVLGTEGLGLSTASVVEPEDIAAGFELDLPEEDGLVVQASIRVRVRAEVAEARAARAEAALSAFEAEVAALEREGVTGNALSAARWRRFAAALAWRMAATKLAEQRPGARASLERATDAVGRHVMPPWVGMPRR